MHSVSGASSLVQISLPSAPTPSTDESVEAFTAPRAAPDPPPSPAPATDARSSTGCCTAGSCAANVDLPGLELPPGEWALPTEAQLRRAAALPLTGADGTSVRFGALFGAHRTAVVFIRHFWCPLCQDYMRTLRARVRPALLARWAQGGADGALVGFVVIGNGAHGMIRKYRKMFALPFAVYTDPTRAVYRALGMGAAGDDGHRHAPRGGVPRGLGAPGAGVSVDGGDAHRTGGYVRHGLVGGIARVVVRALRVGMPVWEKGGDIGQLGGEFVLGPGLTCAFAHRMQTTRGHAPIDDVLAAAGVDLVGVEDSRRTTGDTARTAQMTREEEDAWMAQRARSIAALHARKAARRGTPTPTPGGRGARRTPLSVVGEAHAVGGASDSDGEMYGDEYREEEEETAEAVMSAARWQDSESCYSTGSGGDDGRDFIYMDTSETEDGGSWKDADDAHSVGPMASYLFIR
ncbi:hypothetical protein HYPSUDRAFT_143656 [Hypholoma sublateritium FD-334 SS-4]|uniref:Thioredoxin domain-containing protein n=1 Tax=Hypholoma sublateritium (strain FD-334 SS-4) TaxID=945553 RepID=A0A0D2PHE1_HYPSF|nr:hypothetical protein HYPSUDRAFT_143656 [Hypholoma sublateritium FD-334 SS-4]